MDIEYTEKIYLEEIDLFAEAYDELEEVGQGGFGKVYKSHNKYLDLDFAVKVYDPVFCILDRSGSMSGLEQDTIGGFNSMIKQQKNAEGEALISTIDNIFCGRMKRTKSVN